jgi:predicted outer membrane repeat protein
VRYVDGAVAASGDGLGWGTAFQTVQAGVFSASQAMVGPDAPDTCQVWVKTGEYHPTEGGGDDATFLMLANVEVYGGFSDDDEEWGERDWVNNVTTMDGAGVFHVVTCAADAVLDGFMVTGGDAWTSGTGDDLYGAGIHCDGQVFTVRHSVMTGHVAHGTGAGALVTGAAADVTFEDCSFSSSNGHSSGGGLAVESGGTARLIACDFTSNQSSMSGAGNGGAISVTGGATCIIDDCSFASNTAVSRGGAIYSNMSAVEIRDSRFEGNALTFGGGSNYGGAVSLTGGSLLVARTSFTSNGCVDYGRGGAIYLSSSATADLENCTFMDNYLDCSSDTFGGAIYLSSSSADVMNCTFYDNWHDSYEEHGGAIYFNATASGTIRNSIIWGNDPNGIEAATGASYSFTYSDVQGGPWNPADHNLATDPLFEGGTPFDLHIQTTSPCVDTGTSTGAPTDDMEGNLRPMGTGVDMGAYEVI